MLEGRVREKDGRSIGSPSTYCVLNSVPGPCPGDTLLDAYRGHPGIHWLKHTLSTCYGWLCAGDIAVNTTDKASFPQGVSILTGETESKYLNA